MLASLFRADSGGSGDRSPFGNFWFGAVPGRAGSVTPDTAMRLTAVYACVRVLAESFAVLPFRLYRPRVGGGRQRITDHWLHTLFCRAPNPYQTPFEWREMMQGHLAYRGNGYNRIVEDGRGGIAALVPMHPDSVSVEAIGTDEWRYRRTLRDGSTQTLRRDQVWHLRGLGSDGIMGLSPIALAADSLGEAATLQDYSATFFRNNGAPPAWVKVPGKFSDRAARDNFREQIQTAQTDRNRGKFMVLDQGMELQALNVSQRDMQFIEARGMKTTEIARLFRVPPHKIGDLSKATFSNIEQQAIEFWQDSIHPWCERWESSIECSLLGADTDLEVEFDMRGMMRGDAPSRAAYYASRQQWGSLSANEVREYEGEDALDMPGMDVPLRPLNMVPYDQEKPATEVAEAASGISDAEPGRPVDDEPGDEAATAEARLHQVVRGNAARMARRIVAGNPPTAPQLAEALGVPERMAAIYLPGAAQKAACAGYTELTMTDDLMAFALLTWKVNPT